MSGVFDTLPDGLQPAPKDAAALAAGAGVPLHGLDLRAAHSKADLMDAFAAALTLRPTFGRNWDALYDVLTDGEPRLALLLRGAAPFAAAHPRLWADLEGVLLDAQTAMAGAGRALWLLLGDR